VGRRLLPEHGTPRASLRVTKLVKFLNLALLSLNIWQLTKEEADMPLVEKDGVTPASCVGYHPNDKLAEMIVHAWLDHGFRQRLLSNAAEVFEKAGLYIDNPLVVTEDDFNANTYVKDNQVLFVLPNPPSDQKFSRPHIQGSLLDTARLKMAYTCCGI
jgi:hypothetical protein